MKKLLTITLCMLSNYITANSLNWSLNPGTVNPNYFPNNQNITIIAPTPSPVATVTNIPTTAPEPISTPSVSNPVITIPSPTPTPNAAPSPKPSVSPTPTPTASKPNNGDSSESFLDKLVDWLKDGLKKL